MTRKPLLTLVCFAVLFSAICTALQQSTPAANQADAQKNVEEQKKAEQKRAEELRDQTIKTITASRAGLQARQQLSDDVYAQALSDVEAEQQAALTALTADPSVLNRSRLLAVYNTLRQKPSPTATQTSLVNLIRGLLVKDNLIAPFAAVVDAATEITSSGNQTVQSAKGSNQPQARGMIRFESPHWEMKCCADFSVRGQFGYMPIFTLVNLTNGTTPVTPSLRTLYQQGFNWGFRPQVSAAAGEHGEITLFGEYGENILPDTVSSFTQSNATITATTIANGPGNAASYWQSGLEFKLYTHTLAQTHLDQKFFSPLFSVNASYKDDSRLQRAADLASFHNPAERLEFGFMVTLTNITGFKDDSVPASGASVEFGVQRDAPIGGSTIPPATRIIIRSTLDILKLLNPQKE